MAMKSPDDISEMNGAHLCSHCSVLPFNDAILASLRNCVPGTDELRFDLTAPAPEHPSDCSATNNKDPDSIQDLPAMGGRPHFNFPLDYEVADLLPGLPYLEQSARQGCEFCSLLRLEIKRLGYNITGFVDITLAYHLNLPGYGMYGLGALVANVVQRLDTSCIPPYSTVANLDIVFAVESDDGQSPLWVLCYEGFLVSYVY